MNVAKNEKESSEGHTLTDGISAHWTRSDGHAQHLLGKSVLHDPSHRGKEQLGVVFRIRGHETVPLAHPLNGDLLTRGDGDGLPIGKAAHPAVIASVIATSALEYLDLPIGDGSGAGCGKQRGRRTEKGEKDARLGMIVGSRCEKKGRHPVVPEVEKAAMKWFACTSVEQPEEGRRASQEVQDEIVVVSIKLVLASRAYVVLHLRSKMGAKGAQQSEGLRQCLQPTKKREDGHT